MPGGGLVTVSLRRSMKRAGMQTPQTLSEKGTGLLTFCRRRFFRRHPRVLSPFRIESHFDSSAFCLFSKYQRLPTFFIYTWRSLTSLSLATALSLVSCHSPSFAKRSSSFTLAG